MFSLDEQFNQKIMIKGMRLFFYFLAVFVGKIFLTVIFEGVLTNDAVWAVAFGMAGTIFLLVLG